MSFDLERHYEACKAGDVHAGTLMPILRNYAAKCRTVFELGTANCHSASAFLLGGARLVSVDHLKEGWKQNLPALRAVIGDVQAAVDGRFMFIEGDSREVECPEEYDLLFVDSEHTYECCIAELRRHGPKAKKWILLHDTDIFGKVGDPGGGEGLLKAIDEFLAEQPEWERECHYTLGSGMTILRRIAAHPVAMVKHVMRCLEKADRFESGLSPEALMVPGLTSLKIRHFLNNLNSIPMDYLEIGLHKGGTFVSSLFGNQPQSAVACDNWAQMDQTKQTGLEFFANCKQFLPDQQFKVIERDCFYIKQEDMIRPVNLYLYDGNHDYDAQFSALTHFYPMLADVFIFLCDDFNWPQPRQATLEAIKALALKPWLQLELSSFKDFDNEAWWNGLFVGVFEK